MKQELYYPPSIVPTRIQHYLLKAAILDFDDAVNYWQLIKQELGLDDLENKKSPTTLALIYDKLDHVSASLLPMVYYNLQQLDDQLLQSIKSYYRYLWARNHYLLSIAQKVALKASHNGSRTTLLKGLAIAFYYAPDPALRMMNDIDVLIDPSKIDETLDYLSRNYKCKESYRLQKLLGFLHSATYLPDNKIEIDVHWQVTHHIMDWDPYNESNAFLETKFANIDVLEPTRAFFHSIIHGTIPNLYSTIRWISDCYLIQKNHSINWHLLLDFAQKYDHVYQVRIGLEILKEYIQIPDIILVKVKLFDINKQQIRYIKKSQSFMCDFYHNKKNHKFNNKLAIKWASLQILYYHRLAFKRVSYLDNYKDNIIFVGYLTYIVLRKIKRILAKKYLRTSTILSK